MAIHRTAMGKTVDMSSLASKNEHTRAVGNMKVNARGDTIDAMGRITNPVTSKVNDMYSKTVGNRSAQVRSRQAPVASSIKADIDVSTIEPVVPIQAIVPEELTEMEQELEDNLDDDIEIEKIKATQTQTTQTKTKK